MSRKNVQTGFQPVNSNTNSHFMCNYFKYTDLTYFELQDSDVYITYEDQQKINKFARQNAKMDDIKEELKIKQVIILVVLIRNSYHL